MGRKQGKTVVVERAPNTYVGIRMNGELMQKLRERAAKNQRTIGGELNTILQDALSESPRKGR
jgi:Arc-like DNA binding domain